MDSTAKTEKPSRLDNLTRTARQSLYSPEAYTVTQMGPTEFFLENENGATMTAWDCYGRGFNLRSNSGNEHLVMLGCCTCMDKERALKQSRLCKHEAACASIENYLDRGTQPERIADTLADRQKIAREALAATFAGAA